MYFSQSEHGIPHFHAIYGEHNAVLSIENSDVIEGDLPPRAERMVKEWATQHKLELMAMWKDQNFHQIPGLE
jgi:hypothetical protein